jgi:hypothetical protein
MRGFPSGCGTVELFQPWFVSVKKLLRINDMQRVTGGKSKQQGDTAGAGKMAQPFAQAV